MVVVVPDIEQYNQMPVELRYKTVSNLKSLLYGKNKEVGVGGENSPEWVIAKYKAGNLLAWVIVNESETRIVNKARSIIEKRSKD